MRFVDTNVLIYAVSPSAGEAEKRRRAQNLLLEGDLALSVQVLQEFYAQVTRPRLGRARSLGTVLQEFYAQVTRPSRAEALTHSQALRFIESIREFPVQDITLAVFRAGVSLSRRFRLSYCDGAILAAARACGCEAVYSEDLSDRQDYDGMRVINPFGKQEDQA